MIKLPSCTLTKQAPERCYLIWQFSNAIKEYDAETGLYYLDARYYDSKIARFLSEDTYTGDPNDPLSLNLYTYWILNSTY